MNNDQQEIDKTISMTQNDQLPSNEESLISTTTPTAAATLSSSSSVNTSQQNSETETQHKHNNSLSAQTEENQLHNNNNNRSLSPTRNTALTTSNINNNTSIEEIDAAHAGDSDSWETESEGDFYSTNHSAQSDDDDDDEASGLSKHLINIYPLSTAEESGIVGNVCDICLNEYKPQDKLRLLPCFHKFHQKCIDKWLRKNAKCPVDRSDLRKSKWYCD